MLNKSILKIHMALSNSPNNVEYKREKHERHGSSSPLERCLIRCIGVVQWFTQLKPFCILWDINEIRIWPSR